MHSLQSEMSRLKNQLGRYSKKAVMNTESIYTPTESLAKQTFTNAVTDLEEEEYNSQYQGTNYENMGEELNTAENDNDYINLIPDYQYSEMDLKQNSYGNGNKQQNFGESLISQEDERENYGGIWIINEVF